MDLFVWDAVPEQFRKQIEAEHVVLVEKEERALGDEWEGKTLDQLGPIFTGKTPSSSHPEYYGCSIPFVTPRDLDGRRRIDTTERYLTEQGANSVSGSRIPAGAIMVSCIGSDMGKSTIADQACVTNQQINSIVVTSADDPLFIYYNLSTRKEEIRANAGGSAQPILNKSAFGKLEIKLPSLPEQRAIAHILGTLDDKIELNRCMNETLEEMARALFKSWFVDFLPVRAKMAAKQNNPSLLLPQAESGTWFVYAIECADNSLYIGQTENLRKRWLQHSSSKGGRWTKSHPPQRVAYWEKQPSRQAAVEREEWLKTGFGRKWLKKEIAARTQIGDPVRAKIAGRDTGLPKPLADLFPDRLVDSELGPIPEGWEIGCFGDIVDQVRDKENPLASPDTVFHHFSIPAFDNSQLPQIERGEDIKSQKSRVPPGVILLSKLNPEVERVWFVDVASDERAICSTEFLVLQARQPFQRSYVYCLARSPVFRQQIESLVTGTSKSHQRAPAGAVLALEATIPSSQVIRAFGWQASVLLERSVGFRKETIRLATLRDALLPKLISGEMRVKAAEKFIGRAV